MEKKNYHCANKSLINFFFHNSNYLLLLFFLILGLFIVKDYGLSTDEPFHRTNGYFWYLNLVEKFIGEYIEKTSDDFKIEWRNIHFIWKQFLSSNNLPVVIFSNCLKNILKSIISYNEETDSFIGVTSKYLPIYKDFIQFWDTTITNSSTTDFENELEIDEICSLFKQWSKNKNVLSEENIIRVLKHFFSTEIIDDKYVLNITSTIWDKLNDIEKSTEFIKQEIKDNHKLSLISFDDLYNFYNKYCTINAIKFIVSKRYFEKYLYYKFTDYIVYEKFIRTEWIDC